jgi:WD40 repeat protein
MHRWVTLLIAGFVAVAPARAQDRSLAVQQQKKAAAPATRFSTTPLFAVRSEAHSGAVPHMALTLDERYLVTAGFDRTVRIWDAKTGEPRRQYFMRSGSAAGSAPSARISPRCSSISRPGASGA